LGHAIALSHLVDIVQHWEKVYEPTDRQYLADVTRRFVVRYDEFPLAYLLGLAEALLEVHAESDFLDLGDLDEADDRRVSRFFVSKIDVGERNEPTTITLTVWLDDLEEEIKATYAPDGIKGLLGTHKSSRTEPQKWKIEDQHTYRELRLQHSMQDNVRWHDTHWQHRKEDAVHVAAPAFDILLISLRLRRFQDRYRCDKRFRVRFDNVRSENGKGHYDVILD
jgi:hypothetical protein